MESQRFDDLTKRLAGPVSRRAAMKAGLITALGGVLALGSDGRAAQADNCKGQGEKCNKDTQCCSGTCNAATDSCGCASGTTLCNGNCRASCPAGQILTGDCNCVCGPGTIPCGSGGCGPICTGGKALNPTSCLCECPAGTQECNGVCASVSICNGICCAAGQSCCGGTCINTSGDVHNCGACGKACKANETCTSGQCVCATSLCLGVCCPAGNSCCAAGCTDTQTDPANCGGCGRPCPTGPNAQATCINGTCSSICSSGFADCNNNPNDGCETNIVTDPNNCGACGHVCRSPNAQMACINRTCVIVACNSGFADCNHNPNDGCETNIVTDPKNCGTCNNVCGFFTHTCSGGVCV